MSNNEIQNVKIVASEIGLRATSLRANITNLVSIRKVGSDKEFRNAMKAFDASVDEFRKVII